MFLLFCRLVFDAHALTFVEILFNSFLVPLDVVDHGHEHDPVTELLDSL